MANFALLLDLLQELSDHGIQILRLIKPWADTRIRDHRHLDLRIDLRDPLPTEVCPRIRVVLAWTKVDRIVTRYGMVSREFPIPRRLLVYDD